MSVKQVTHLSVFIEGKTFVTFRQAGVLAYTAEEVHAVVRVREEALAHVITGADRDGWWEGRGRLHGCRAVVAVGLWVLVEECYEIHHGLEHFPFLV